VVWQLRGEISGQDRETRAVRLFGLTFFALAAYLTAEAIRDLATHARPGEPIPGPAISGTALIMMPGPAIAKRRTGRALGSRTLIADSAETAFCAWTSAATLTGVGLNAALGWWWADPASRPWPSPPSRSGRASRPGATTTAGPARSGPAMTGHVRRLPAAASGIGLRVVIRAGQGG